MLSALSLGSTRARAVLAVFVAATVMAVAPPASAGKRGVVLLKVRAWGPQGAVCARAVKNVLRSEHRLMSTPKYLRTRQKLRRTATTPKNVAAVAAAVGADAIVFARVVRRYGKSMLVIRIRAGKTGEVAKDLRIPMPRGRCGARTVERLRKELSTTIADIAPIDEAADEPPSAKPVADAEPTPDSEPTPTDTPAVAKASTASRGGSVFSTIGGSVDLGVSAIGRRLEFAVDGSVPEAMRPREYDGGLVGGVHVDAELYPFMHKTRPSRVAGLGLSFSLDQSVSMKSTLSMNGTEQQFATTQSRWAVGMIYRIPLGRRGAFKLAAGYDQLGVEVDSGNVDTGVPDVSYGYLDAGASVELPLGSRLMVRLGGRYLHLMDAGEIAVAAAYGQATMTGFSALAGIDLDVTSKLRVRAGLSFVRMDLSFDGSGQMTDVNADDQQDVRGARDTYAGGFVSAGYTF